MSVCTIVKVMNKSLKQQVMEIHGHHNATQLLVAPARHMRKTFIHLLQIFSMGRGESLVGTGNIFLLNNL